MPSTDSTEQYTGYPVPQKKTGCPTLAASLFLPPGWDSKNSPHTRGSLILTSIISSLKRLTPLFASILLLSLTLPAQAPLAPAARFIVVLDAAHGGDDPGGPLKDSSGSTRAEKTYTLALSVRLRSLLAARGISVVTTRESDSTVDPARRAEIANHANAAACLSLHASESGSSGIHLYASSLAPAEPARLVPWKTAQAAAVTRSLAFAGVLNSALQHAGMTVTLGRTALPAIDSMTCPAVAIEVAPELVAGQPQPPALDDSGYQTRVAQALAAAILEWRTVASHTGASPAEAAQP
jgi:N-acetylmuramoyl-L-alanine amidase